MYKSIQTNDQKKLSENFIMSCLISFSFSSAFILVVKHTTFSKSYCSLVVLGWNLIFYASQWVVLSWTICNMVNAILQQMLHLPILFLIVYCQNLDILI